MRRPDLPPEMRRPAGGVCKGVGLAQGRPLARLQPSPLGKRQLLVGGQAQGLGAGRQAILNPYAKPCLLSPRHTVALDLAENMEWSRPLCSLPGRQVLCDIVPMPSRLGTSMDIFVELYPLQNGTVSGWFCYDKDLFEEATISRMAGHYVELVNGVIRQIDEPMSHVDMYLPGEKEQISETYVCKWKPITPDSFAGLFCATAAEHPDRPATLFEGATLTYAQLDQRSSQLAHLLVSLGAGPEVAVGLHVERSADLLVMILGIMKSGAYYLPMDPAYPKDRLQFMMEDSSAPIVLTQASLRGSLDFAA
eukprot:354568-Chlamydomonas_euryale.AAC.2